MKKIFLCVASILSFSFSFSQIIVGKNISEMMNAQLLDSSISLLTSPSHFEEAKILIIDSVFYEAILTQSGMLKEIYTSDSNFSTSETIRVGDSFAMLRKKCKTKLAVINLNGWGNYIKLQSGWNAVFDFGKPISNNSQVLFFFQSISSQQHLPVH